MSYFLYLFKKLTKNKKNYFPFVLILMGIIGLYTLNVTEGKVFDYQYNLEQNYRALQEIEDLYLQDLQNEDYTDEDIAWIEGGLEDNTERLEWIEEGLAAIEKEDWQTALQNSIHLTNRILSVNEEEGANLFPDEHIQVLEKDIALYEELIEINARPETEGYEQAGINFTYRVMYTLFPLFITLIFTIYATIIFSSSIKKGEDIDRLFPEPYAILVLKKIIFTIMISVSLYLLILLISFGLGSVISEVGTFEYPIFNSLSIEQSETIIQVSMKMFLIQVMVIVCVVLVTGIFSIITKNQLIAVMLSIVMTIGIPIIIKVTSTFSNSLHFIPFTYFLSGEVVSGALSLEKTNLNITFINGMLSLSLFSLVLLGILLTCVQQEDKNRMLKTEVM